MVVCDCCNKPIRRSSRVSFAWEEEGETPERKDIGYDLCEDCRKSLLKCFGKGPIWEYVERVDREHAELVSERNGLYVALEELADRYRELKNRTGGNG